MTTYLVTRRVVAKNILDAIEVKTGEITSIEKEELR